MMRCNTYILMAAMAVSGVGMSVNAADNTGPFDTANNAAAQMQQVGGQMADEAAAKSVRSTLAKIVNDALTQKDFSTVTNYLTKADRDRLGDVKGVTQDDLNAVINQFRQDFKSKYNQDFDISSDQLKNVLVYAGQDKNAATVTIAKPSMSSAAMDSMNTSNMPSHTTTPMTNNGTNGATETNTQGSGATADRMLNTTGNEKTVSNRSGDNSGSGMTSTSNGNRTGQATNGSNNNSTVRGNDVAATPGTVVTNTNGMTNGNTGNTAPSTVETGNMNTGAGANPGMASANTAGMSSLTLNLVNEGRVMNAWRISTPQLSAEQLKQNLTKHIQMCDDQKAAWPADVNAAYQAVSYHILSAFSDSAMASDR